MSLAHLNARSTKSPRDRVLALVTRLEGDRLDLAEQALEHIVEHQDLDTRGLTGSEISALASFGVDEAALRAPSPMTATLRSAAWERSIEQASFAVSEVAALLGVTPARVRQRCAEGTLLARRRSDGWRLPRFQFPEDRELGGWSTVAAAISPSTALLLVERVLTSPTPRLRVGEEELAPLEWLAQGGDPEAAAAAVDDALNRLP